MRRLSKNAYRRVAFNLIEGRMSRRSSRTLYVGNLPGNVRERDVEDLFYKYGPIVEIDLKIPPRPPGYAFVEFEDPRDAEDAIRGRDGCKYDGQRLRVELAHGGRGSSSSDRYSSYSSGGSRGGVSSALNFVVHLPSVFLPYASYFLLMKELLIHHSEVLVTGLPHSASWQDLKDHMRQAGDVCFSQVFRDYDGYGMRGIVDYTNYEDMKYAIRKLNDTLFRNQFSKGYIRVCHNGLSVLNFVLRAYTDMASHLCTNTRWKSMIRGVAIPGAAVGVHIIQEAEAQVAAIATVAGAGAGGMLDIMGKIKSPQDKYSRRALSRSRSRSISSRSWSELARLSVSSFVAIIMKDCLVCFLDVASAPTWGLHVRDLMEYGAQIPASRLVVAVCCVVHELL
ncbi:hypothetical protein RJ639_038085 [Escallonia herrerae]|uniref:RRM domain-containing protein n=1 Tax=Escallonia herrerae TaxID=1293975 RepID=A0AA89BFE3_9ASTE|nr:hypothetical protein RJ639_038085 [Escallonia herrerae]